MERIVINHCRTKHKPAPNGYVYDHIIPHCLSIDNSKSNLQLIKIRDHKLKTIKDFKIIKELRNMGWIEKITHYSHELIKDQKEIIDYYKRRFVEL